MKATYRNAKTGNQPVVLISQQPKHIAKLIVKAFY